MLRKDSEASLAVLKKCIQFHGAMGYTHEPDISLFFSRAMALAAAGGNAPECRKQFHAEARRLEEGLSPVAG